MQQALLHWTHPEAELLQLLVLGKALQLPWLAQAGRPQGTPLLRQQMLLPWALAVVHVPLLVLRPQSQLQVKRLEALQQSLEQVYPLLPPSDQLQGRGGRGQLCTDLFVSWQQPMRRQHVRRHNCCGR